MEHSTWHRLLKEELPDHYFSKINQFMDKVYEEGTIYPPRDKVFNALLETPFEEVRVVILGQDPYHGPNQAQGLSFSVPETIPAPPSLVNILKELGEDLGPRSHHDLTTWAEQGQIWEPFTDAVIKVLNQKDTPVVFILWGGYARKKKSLVTNPKHAIIESAHPSPLSAYRGFFGSKPFSKANAYLVSQGQPPIDWLK